MRLGYKGAGCLVLHYDEKTHKVFILLGKRTSGVGAGTWSIPGGGWETKDGPINSKESLKNTARRELFEETNIRLNPAYYLMEIWEARFVPFFEYSVYAVRLAKKIKIKRWSEFQKVEWFDVNNLPKNTFWMVSDQVRNLIKIMKEKGYKLEENYFTK